MSEQHETEDTTGDVQPWTKGAELKEGTRIDRYQILGLLGKGGMGAVYKAYDPELDRSIAIKILTVKPEEGETASRPQARLMREAQALAKLSHPNVVSVFDVGTYEQGIYIAMEYVKGKTLREWLRGQQLQHKEIIQTLSKAGKGLHAAHTEGIVHRDFKPDNVIIGDRGQVKVLDFGLARAAGTQDTTVPHRIEESVEDSTSGEKLLSKPLTRVGAIIGTTVYMAPEHFQFQDLDEKTDQFSFSVTLFEALYGKRPFLGKTSEELEENITSGWIEVPKEAEVSRWIEEIILKGLSVSKNERHLSMLELLEALEDDPDITRTKRRKKIQLASLILILCAMTLGFGYYAFFRSTEVCTGAEKKVAGVWDEEKRESINQAFEKTELSYANDSFVRVEKRLGEYLQKWKNTYTETCEATRLRDEQPVEIMVIKMRCLDKHLRNAGALVRVFADADKTVVQKSVQAVSSLSDISSCHDVEALRSRVPPPKDEQTKNKVATIREKLSEVEAFNKTGKYKEGLEAAEKLEEEAKSVKYKPVVAEVLYQLGHFLERVGEYKKAEKKLHTAVRLAGESRDGLLAAKAMTAKVWVIGYKQARYDAGLLLAQDAEVILNIAGGEEKVKALLLNHLGTVLQDQGKYEKALECYQNSWAIREKALGSKHPLVAQSLNNIGIVFWRLGHNEKALEHYNKSLTISEKVLGPKHTDVSSMLNNMGAVFREQGKYRKALEYYVKALAIYEKALGPEHPLVSYALSNMGYVFVKQGEYAKALIHYRRAESIFAKKQGPDHPALIVDLCGIASVLIKQGRPKEALKPLERVEAICEKKTCQSQSHGTGLFYLARTLVATGGNKERAIRLARQAKEIFRKFPKRFKKDHEEVRAWLKKHVGSDRRSISTAKR